MSTVTARLDTDTQAQLEKLAAENLPGIKVGWLERIKLGSKIGVHHFSCVSY